jgi:hypothetical protein
MSSISIVVNILAGLAVLIIICYIIKYLWDLYKHRKDLKINSQINPPGSYMQNSGIKCPDYWVNTGVDPDGNYKCHNSFNIETVNPTSGSYAGKCNPVDMRFPHIDSGYTWEYGDPDGLTSYTDQEKYDFLNKSVGNSISRCQWINYCGPSTNVQGIWSGVNEICNNPPLSS